MMPVEEKARPPISVRPRRHPVKLTALLYLRDALRLQRYEVCSEFIAVAREFGAKEREIEELLEDSRRMPR